MIDIRGMSTANELSARQVCPLHNAR